MLLADPRPDRPLPSIPAGRVPCPCWASRATAAEAVLDEDAGAAVTIGARRRRGAARGRRGATLSPFSSRGPSAAGSPKPDVAAPGAAATALAGGGGAIAGGTAVAAANAALAAAQLIRERPAATPDELRRALVSRRRARRRACPPAAPAPGASASPPPSRPSSPACGGPGGGDPCTVGGACARIVLRNQGATPADLGLDAVADPGTAAELAAPQLTDPARRRPRGRDRHHRGARVGPRHRPPPRRAARSASPSPSRPPRPRRRRSARSASSASAAASTGVSFALGSFERGDPLGAGTSIELTERLELTLVREGGIRAVRRLTPPGGARELLPARYAYTLPTGDARRPPARPLRLPRRRPRARAAAAPAVAVSEAFDR